MSEPRTRTKYTYDNNGNTLTKVDSTGTTTYAWDFENRLTSVTLPGSGGTVTFKYDPFGRRIYKSSSTTTSVFAYDRNNLIEETNSSGVAQARYSQGLNMDEPLAMLRSAATSFYLADGLGSVTSLSNGAGSIANTYAYDSFGKLTNSTGSVVSPFKYTARESDTETGLYYYRARYYDPQIGRFIGEDPFRFNSGDVNLYAYVVNNPTNRIDPTGLWEAEVGVGHGVGVLVRFGYSSSSGQWNFGFFGGAAEGAFFSYDPMDQGCHQPEFVGGILGEGEVGLGKHFGVSGESDFNGGSSATGSLIGPGGANLTFNLLNLKEPPHGTLAFGLGGFVGIGGTTYFSCRCSR